MPMVVYSSVSQDIWKVDGQGAGTASSIITTKYTPKPGEGTKERGSRVGRNQPGPRRATDTWTQLSLNWRLCLARRPKHSRSRNDRPSHRLRPGQNRLGLAIGIGREGTNNTTRSPQSNHLQPYAAIRSHSRSGWATTVTPYR